MTSKTTALAATVSPQIRDYAAAAIDEVSEKLTGQLDAAFANSAAEMNSLKSEIAHLRAQLAVVNDIIENDPAHRITKAKILAVAKELNL